MAPQTLSPAGSLAWTNSLTFAHSTTYSVVVLPAVTQGLQSTITKRSYFPSKISIERGNEVTKHSLYSSADKIYGVSGAYLGSASTKVIKTPATSPYTSYSTPNRGKSLLKILYEATQSQNPGMNSVSANNLEISPLFPSNQESQAVQRQRGVLQNPTSALLSAHPKGYSVSSHVTQQMLNQTAYAKKTEVDNQIFVHKSIGDTTMSPLSSHVVNPTVSPAITFRPHETPAGKMSLSETAITELTPIHSGMVSSEHASNTSDLLMAAGHGSPRVPTININYNQGEIAGADPTLISAQAHPNNSLSLTGPRPESATGSIISSITRTGKTSSTSESDLLKLPSNGDINVQELVTQTRSPKGVSQGPIGWITAKNIFSSNSRTMPLSGSAVPVTLAKDMTYKTTNKSLSHTTRPTSLLPSFLNHSPNNTGLSANSEANLTDQPKTSSSPHTPSQRPFKTRSLITFHHKFYTTSGVIPLPNKSTQTLSSAKISAHIIKFERAGRNIPFEVETNPGNSKTSPASDGHMKPTESFHRNPAKSSVSPLLNGNEESTVIGDTVFYKKGVPLGQFTTYFPSFITTKDFFMFNKGSEGSGKGSPTEIPFSPVASDAALEPLKSISRKDGVTHTGRFEQSSPSTWSEIILTPRTNSTSRSQDPITSVRSDRSFFYLGRQRSIPSTASSAATTSSSDGQNSIEPFSAIFSFGTKLMAPYIKWEATKRVSFQSTAFDLENRANSHLQADGPSYEHPELEDGQEGNVHILNLTDPSVVTSDPISFYPTVGEYPSFTHFEGTLEYKQHKLNVSPANLISAVDVNVQQGGTVNTAWGSDGFLPLSHTTTDSATSSKASPLALVYKSKHAPPLPDVDSLQYAFDAAVTLSNNPALNFSDTDNINSTTDVKLRGLTLLTELGPSSSFHSSSLTSSETSPQSFTQSSLHMKPPTSVSYKVSSTLMSSSTLYSVGKILSIKPTMIPGTASSSVSVKATFPSLHQV